MTTNQTALVRPTLPRIFAWVARLQYRLAVQRTRRHLARLSDHYLSDIGITRAEAEEEARRRVWDAPDTWIR